MGARIHQFMVSITKRKDYSTYNKAPKDRLILIVNSRLTSDLSFFSFFFPGDDIEFTASPSLDIALTLCS